MVVCFVSDSYPLTQPFGGMAIYTETAARAMSARGHQVHVVVGWRGESCDREDGRVKVHYRTVRWLPLIGSILPGLGESLGLAKVIRGLDQKYHFDLVEFPNFEGHGLAFQMFQSTPVVVRLHTSMVESVEVQQRRPTIGERYMMWAERQSARRAQGVVTHSISHRDRLGRVYGLPNIRLIRHGIQIPADRPRVGSRLSVLTIGHLSERKGGATLLAAIVRVLEQVPDVTFVIVGATGEEPVVRSFRESYPEIQHSRIVFRRFVSEEDLNALYAASTIYVSASVYESFGLTFVEAMARGIPVVACAVSAMTEIIRHDATGLLVPPGDPEAFSSAIVRLLGDAELRERLGRQGRRECLEKYTADRMGAEIEAWYGEVLSKRGA